MNATLVVRGRIRSVGGRPYPGDGRSQQPKKQTNDQIFPPGGARFDVMRVR
jgi:hypothetical protein